MSYKVIAYTRRKGHKHQILFISYILNVNQFSEVEWLWLLKMGTYFGIKLVLYYYYYYYYCYTKPSFHFENSMNIYFNDSE